MTETVDVRPYSVSSTATYLTCPKLYWAKYRSDVPRPERHTEPDYLRRGSAYHAALEAAFKAAQADVSPRSAGTRMDAYRQQALEALEASWTEQGLPRTFGSWDSAVGAVTVVLEALPALPAEAILGVELEIRQDTPDGHPFVGFVDLVMRADDHTLRIWDWKNSKKLKTRAALAADVQTNGYGYFLLGHYPWADRLLIGNYSLSLLSKVELVSEPGWREAAITRIDTVIGWIEQDQVFAPKVSDECSTCFFKPQCPAWDDRTPYGEVRNF